ncbi:MAG: FkbM family methyltransferase [Planctomycetes bacterium]|nr:FkbM family methyltransferase [Planctomycetota bacterium]
MECPYPIKTRGNGFYWACNPRVPDYDLDLRDHEDWILEYLRVPVDGLFVDVGASIGAHAIRVARLRHCRVLAIEPHPAHRELLVLNAMLNGVTLTVLPVAVGATTTEVRMAGIGGGCHVARYDQSPNTFVIQQDTLDNLVGDQRADCVKIDVEGYECEVLAGAHRLAQSCRPTFVVEVHSHFPHCGSNGNLIVDWCAEHRYECRRIWQNTEAYYYVQLTPA